MPEQNKLDELAGIRTQIDAIAADQKNTENEISPDELERYQQIIARAEAKAKEREAQEGPDESDDAVVVEDAVPADIPAGKVVDFEECGSCGKSHSISAINKYSTPQPPYTHWYICPTTGDPCGASIVSQNGKEQTINASVLSRLATAHACENFLVAICWVDNGKLKYTRQALSFPHRFFHDCAEHVRQDLESEVGPPQPAEPMAIAPALQPVVNPFAK